MRDTNKKTDMADFKICNNMKCICYVIKRKYKNTEGHISSPSQAVS